MPSTILRRARGIAVTAITWALAWAPIGAASGALLGLVKPWPGGMTPPVRDLAVGMGIAGAIAGAVCGIAYASLLLFTARRRRFEQLRLHHVGTLGAVAATAAALLISRDLVFSGICGGFGLLASSGSLAMARKAVAAPRRDLELEAEY